ncbi:MAG TPA: M20/M25/M40 family metallo-hydrolase, partial [Kofleriaceae bacterium]|nr:M20/M25/M40 family metallo-hydrolase [Kofleriaceae bacterium]
MRSASVLALLVCASCAGAPAEPAETGVRYVSIGRDALDAALAVADRRGAALDVLDLDADVAVIALPAGDLGLLAEQIHARHDRCGGFMVHDSYAEARAAIPVHTDPDHADPSHAVRPELDYPIDHADAVRRVLPEVDASQIRDTIRTLSAMPTRHYQSRTGAEAARWLQARWRSLTGRPDVTVELFDHGYAQPSVIMTVPGTTRASEVIVIGGHLDSINLSGGAAPGADDDASGIATLTEVARVLLAQDYRPERTIQFMAYAAEEVGLRGSQLIVRDYQRRGIHVVGALQLDMTNYQGSDRDIWLMKDYTSAAQNAFLGRLIDTYVGATWGMDACGYACSDHASWNRAGVPASMPFEARAGDRNRAIHTRRDTLETSDASAAHAAKFARLAAAYAIELGKGELGKGELGKGELGKGELGKGELGKG